MFIRLGIANAIMDYMSLTIIKILFVIHIDLAGSIVDTGSNYNSFDECGDLML